MTQKTTLKEAVKVARKASRKIEKQVTAYRKEEASRYSFSWAEEKKKTCKLCQRKKAASFCKRHSPRMNMTTKIYVPKERLEKRIKDLRRDSDLTRIDGLLRANEEGYNQALDDMLKCL